MDNALPYLCDDTELLDYLNEAEREACRRANLLFDANTAEFCSISVTSGTAVYTLDDKVIDVCKADLNGVDGPGLTAVSRHTMDQDYIGWRDWTGEPTKYVIDGLSLQLVPKPTQDYTLNLEVYRLPADDIEYDPEGVPAVDGSPEIAGYHHDYLHHWMLHRAFSKQDSDLFDARKAKEHYDLFEKYFGPAVTASSLRRRRMGALERNRKW